ncbi:MAG: DUF58 domain-containing protein [Actinomycetia bacterium]|nr:DUF58 domain-containing protein [Actinomycetes bacterium]
MLTDKGGFVLLLGGLTYLVGWLFGSDALYPVGIGMVVAVLAGLLWVRFLARPTYLARSLDGTSHIDGDDVRVDLAVDIDGLVPPGSIRVVETVAELGQHEVGLAHTRWRLRRRQFGGSYVFAQVARGRYGISPAVVTVEDAFALASRQTEFAVQGALLVYPRLVELDALFSDGGMHLASGRRLLIQRQSGFDFHSMREYEQGESLRRVHWPSTARRGKLMVKELEDAPREEALVLLDACASTVVGEGKDNTFELAVRAAGSLTRAQAARGRRVGLLLNDQARSYQAVHSLEGDWARAFELLAYAKADGLHPVAGLLTEGAGVASQVLHVTVVTSGLDARLADRLVQRTRGKRGTALVYIEGLSFSVSGASADRPPAIVHGQLTRLERAGVPVAVLRRGDDLAERLAFQPSTTQAASVG